MLKLLKEEHMIPKEVKKYEFIKDGTSTVRGQRETELSVTESEKE